MTFEEYRVAASRTQNLNLSETETMMHGICGLVAECGEFNAEMTEGRVGKALYEAGDIYWMVAELCDVLGINITSEDIENAYTVLFPFGKVAKLCGMIQKKYQGHEIDLNAATEALASVLKSPAIRLAQRLDFGTAKLYISDRTNRAMELIMRENIRKLEKRYPDGFSAERSVNREVEE